jgi:hypothetical protein
MSRRKLTKAQRRLIHNKTSGHCAYCGCDLPLAKMAVDHVNPLYLGGADELDNMLPSCNSCNHYKSTFTVEGFRKQIGMWLTRLERDSVTYKNALRYGLIKKYPHEIIFYFERAHPKRTNTTGKESAK